MMPGWLPLPDGLEPLPRPANDVGCPRDTREQAALHEFSRMAPESWHADPSYRRVYSDIDRQVRSRTGAAFSPERSPVRLQPVSRGEGVINMAIYVLAMTLAAMGMAISSLVGGLILVACGGIILGRDCLASLRRGASAALADS